MLHPQNRKPKLLCHYCGIIFRVKITDHYLRLHLQKCFQPPDRLLQALPFEDPQDLPHKEKDKTVIHTNAEGVLKFSTCCDHLAFQGVETINGRGAYPRERRII